MDRCSNCGARWNLGDNQWIKCSDRLPESNKLVLVFHEIWGVHIDKYDGELKQWRYDRDRFPSNTHWMPLPAPPKD